MSTRLEKQFAVHSSNLSNMFDIICSYCNKSFGFTEGMKVVFVCRDQLTLCFFLMQSNVKPNSFCFWPPIGGWEVPEHKCGSRGQTESVTRPHGNEGDTEESPDLRIVGGELSLPMKMAARSHTVRSSSASPDHMNMFCVFFSRLSPSADTNAWNQTGSIWL